MSQGKRPHDGPLPVLYIHLIGAAACVLMVTLAWFAGVGPVLTARAQAAAQRAQIAEHERDAAKLRNQVVQVERLISRAAYRERQSPLRLEPVERINRRLSEVSSLAAKVGLDVSVIRPRQVQRRPRYEVVPIQLQGLGAFRATTLFLDRLHDTFPDMGVASVEVRARPADKQGMADFALTLIWYAAPDAAGGAGGATADAGAR